MKNSSRFWNVSGFKGDFSLSGATVQMESLAALVNGAIAFDSPADAQQAKGDQNYTLYPDLAHSQRGVNILLDLPSGNNLSENRTPLMYQGLQVGTLTKLTLQQDSKVVGELTIDPSVVDLMRSGTRIVMRSPRISLNDAKLSQLLTGTTLELVPGEGEPQQRFNVLDSSETLLQQPGVLTVTLNAPQSYGIDVGQPLVVHGVKVGQILSRTLTAGGVVFTAAIDAQYRGLLHKDSKFVVNSRLDVKQGIDGMEVLGASAQEWVDGGVRIIPGSKGEPGGQYPLYANSEKAEEGIVGNAPATTLTLSATSLPDVQAGSVVLYRKFQVGEIVNVRPKANEFEVDVYISPEYRKLLTRESIFWAEGGAKVQLNGSGLTVQASPLNRALKGAISFDNLQGVTLNKGANRVLYASETAARAVGSQITLKTYDASKLSAGMPLRYLGIDVGQVESLQLAAGAQRSVGQSGAVSGIRADLRAPGQPLLDRFAGDLRRRRQQPRYPAPALYQRGAGARPRATHLRAATGQHHRLALSRRPERGARRRRNWLAADRHAGVVPRRRGRHHHRLLPWRHVRPGARRAAHQQEVSASGAQQQRVLAGFGVQPAVRPDRRCDQERHLPAVHPRRYRLRHAADHSAGTESNAEQTLPAESGRAEGLENLGHRHSARLNFAFSSGPGIAGPCFFPLCGKLTPLSLLHPESSPRGQIHRRFSAPRFP